MCSSTCCWELIQTHFSCCPESHGVSQGQCVQCGASLSMQLVRVPGDGGTLGRSGLACAEAALHCPCRDGIAMGPVLQWVLPSAAEVDSSCMAALQAMTLHNSSACQVMPLMAESDSCSICAMKA